MYAIITGPYKERGLTHYTYTYLEEALSRNAILVSAFLEMRVHRNDWAEAWGVGWGGVRVRGGGCRR